MFELLLQADRALSGGNLDQAERTYWQLSELDPTNAIAFAGLARVAMERGDVRLARLFASRALVMDPESVAATRILETIDAREEDPAHEQRPLPVDVPLISAEQLEALSHRRFIRREDSEEAPPSEPPAASADDAAALSEPAPEPLPEAEPAASADSEALPDDAAPLSEAAALSEAAPEPLPEAEPAASADDAAAPSEPTPEPLPEVPVEPRLERGRIGRDLAAAAAEVEAGTADSALRRRPSGRPEFHLAPVPERGHRRFEDEEMKAPPFANDPFAAAESEAVVEALSDLDDSDFAEEPRRAPFRGKRPDAAEDVGGDATSAEGHPDEGDEADASESVALRIALLGDEIVLEVEDAGPESSAEPDDLLDLRLSFLAGESDFEAAEGAASEGSAPTGPQEDDLIATRMAMLSGDAGLEADEIEASKGTRELETEPEVEGNGTVEPEPPGIVEVRAPAANEATERRLSEWEAESEALSEAVAMVEGEPEGAGESAAGGAAQSSTAADSGSVAGPSKETAEPAKEEPEPEHRRRGFLRRITGG
jgi:tetratricopeptide (TPR) repeat protein